MTSLLRQWFPQSASSGGTNCHDHSSRLSSKSADNRKGVSSLPHFPQWLQCWLWKFFEVVQHKEFPQYHRLPDLSPGALEDINFTPMNGVTAVVKTLWVLKVFPLVLLKAGSAWLLKHYPSLSVITSWNKGLALCDVVNNLHGLHFTVDIKSSAAAPQAQLNSPATDGPKPSLFTFHTVFFYPALHGTVLDQKKKAHWWMTWQSHADMIIMGLTINSR